MTDSPNHSSLDTPHLPKEPRLFGATLFVCTACGACCRWRGYVRMTNDEIDRMAEFVGMSAEEFIDTQMTLTADRRGLTLVEKSNGHCIFYEEPSICKVYPVRPKQCRDFPNKWSFPGFEKECRSVGLRYRKTSHVPLACSKAYFPSIKIGQTP